MYEKAYHEEIGKYTYPIFLRHHYLQHEGQLSCTANNKLVVIVKMLSFDII